MTAVINDVVVTSDIEESKKFIAEVTETIQTIITTPVGSIPLYRNFGIDMSALGYPPAVAKEMLSQELIEKIELFEPRIIVETIDIVTKADGGLDVKITVTRKYDGEVEEEGEDLSTEEDEFYYDDEDYDADEEEEDIEDEQS